MSQLPYTILLIDDEQDILLSLKMLLRPHVQKVFSESNPYHLPRLLRQHKPDLVLLDLNYRRGATTGEDGLAWLGKIKELSPQTQVIIITSYSEVSVAVKALQYGASDFIEKPWQNEHLVEVVRDVLNTTEEKDTTSKTANTLAITDAMVGESPAMLATFKTIQKVAKTKANVLILGENGTGKEMVAKAIHQQSKQDASVFVKVDVGAIPDTLVESEFFGHKKGAFTDAQEDRVGKFEAAQAGTLFLDEIGNLSPAAQSKFLSVLQNMVITPLGTNEVRPVDFRLVCATNENLSEMVNQRMFRQDLYYRINTIEIQVPPLRERTGDIPILVKHFLAIFKEKYERPQLSVGPAAMALLEAYHWPGNVRELRHALERAVILSDEEVLQPADFRLAEPISSPINKTEETIVDLNINDMERKLIIKAMQLHKGNISKAAEDLGLTRAALYRRLDKHGLS